MHFLNALLLNARKILRKFVNWKIGPVNWTVRQWVHACETWLRWEQDVEDEGKTFKVRLVTAQDPRLKTTFDYAYNYPKFLHEPNPCLHVLITQNYHCE